MSTDHSRLLFPIFAPLYEFGDKWGWTILRIVLGIWLLPHGFPKLFGDDAIPTSRNFVAFGWAYPIAWAYFIGAVEFFGGIALILGIGTRLVAAMVAVQFFVITFFIMYPNWGWNKRGMEYVLIMCIIAVLFVLRGGGRHSLDNYLSKEL